MKRKAFQLFALVIASVSLFGISSVGASSNGLGVTPRRDYTIKAGSSVTDQLYVNNLSSTQALTVGVRLVDFGAADETGTPALNLSTNAPQTPWSLKPFMKVADGINVPAGKSAYIPFTITIPAGQGAGSYYSAVQYVAENSASQNKVNVAASSATLLFVNVPGNATESMSLLQFGAFKPSADDQSGSFSSFFFGSQPREMAYRVRNNGNVAEQPVGSLLVKNAFGKQALLLTNVNPKQQLALRGQTRRFQICLNSSQQNIQSQDGQNTTNQVCESPKLFPGRYTATLDVFYGLPGSSQQEIAATATFWYLPWWFLVGILIIIAAIVFGVMWAYRKMTGNAHHKPRR